MQSFRFFLCFVGISWGLVVPDSTLGKEREDLPLADLSLSEVVVRHRLPSDLLFQNAVVPPWKGDRRFSLPGKSLISDLGQDLALPVTASPYAGALTQLRGLGRSSDDTHVQTLGVPLNLPQGGGTDLSWFPGFLWSHYEYLPGGNAGSLEKGATAGALNLVPWTASVLERRNFLGRLSHLTTDRGLNQSAVGLSLGNSAWLLGFSEGEVDGLSGSMSLNLVQSSLLRVRGHFLGTDTVAVTPGFNEGPDGKRRAARWMPILESDIQFSRQSVLKSQMFWDQTYYNDFKSSFFRTRQGGGTLQMNQGPWKGTVGGRWVDYQTERFSAPSERTSMFHLTYLFQGEGWKLEPELEANHMDRFGWSPGGGLGWKIFTRTGKDKKEFFVRTTYSEKSPSLMSRFFSNQWSQPNPNLQREKTWGLHLGTRMDLGKLRYRLEGILQQKEAIHLSVFEPSPSGVGGKFKMENAGSALVTAVRNSFDVGISRGVSMRYRWVWTDSKVEKTGRSYDLVADLSHRFQLALDFKRMGRTEDGDVSSGDWGRLVFSLSAEEEKRQGNGVLPAFASLALSWKVQPIWLQQVFGKKFFVTFNMDNLLNRPYRQQLGMPMFGRRGSLFISAHL